jgi:energy-coupling factor transport system substrate-specific component
VSWQLGAFTVLALALVAGFAWYERQRPDARIVALVGTLSAFAALGRIAFAAVPNVKPTTDIVLLSGYALGGGPGFAVGALAGLTSNFFFGQGPWTPWQMAAWGATGIAGAGLARLASARRRLRSGHRRTAPGAGVDPAPPMSRWPLAIACCVIGFAFTVVQDVGDWVTYSNHSAASLGAYVGAGLGFDAIHAAGCLMFALALGPALTRSIQRFARRLQVEWVPLADGITPVVVLVVMVAALGSSVRAAHAAAGSPAAIRSAAGSYLLAAENADGGFGQAPGQPSNQLYAGWAALGLASAGHDLNDISHGAGLMDYIRAGAGAPPDVGSLERTILVVHAAGLSPRSVAGHDLVAELQRRFRSDGSIGDQVNLTAFAALALRAAGTGAGARTLRWLADQQDRDGGFNFAGTGGSSDVDDTGAVLEALAGDAAAGRVTVRAVSFLRRQQDRDGGFPSQPGAGSNAQSTAWAIQGLEASGVSPAGFHTTGSVSPSAYLYSLAARSGAIDYSRGVSETPVWVTAEALMAMEGKPLPVAAPPAPVAAPVAPVPAPVAPVPAPVAPVPAPVAPSPPARGRSGHAAHGGPAGDGVPGHGASVRRAHAGAAAPSRPSARGHGSPAGLPTSRMPVSVPGLAGDVGLITALVLAPVGLG